jgi:adenylate cyclase
VEFFPIPGIIPIQYRFSKEKHISETIFKGSLVQLSAKGAKVRSENVAKDSIPPVQTNLKLNLLGQNIPAELQEDIYAKVIDKAAENGNFYIHFSAKSPAIQARLDALYQSIKA